MFSKKTQNSKNGKKDTNRKQLILVLLQNLIEGLPAEVSLLLSMAFISEF